MFISALVISLLSIARVPQTQPVDRVLSEQEWADYNEDLKRISKSFAASAVKESIQQRIGQVSLKRMEVERDRKDDQSKAGRQPRGRVGGGARMGMSLERQKEDKTNDAYRKMAGMCTSLADVERICGQMSVHLRWGQMATVESSLERGARQLAAGGAPIITWPEIDFRPGIPEVQAQVSKLYMETLEKLIARDPLAGRRMLIKNDGEFRQLWAKLVTTRETGRRIARAPQKQQKETGGYGSPRSEFVVGLAKLWIESRNTPVIDGPATMKAEYWKQEAYNEDEAFRQAQESKPMPDVPIQPVPGRKDGIPVRPPTGKKL